MSGELQNDNTPEEKRSLSRRTFFIAAKRIGMGLIAFIPGAYALMKVAPALAASPDYIPCQLLWCNTTTCVYNSDPNQSYRYTCYDWYQRNYQCCCSDCPLGGSYTCSDACN